MTVLRIINGGTPTDACRPGEDAPDLSDIPEDGPADDSSRYIEGLRPAVPSLQPPSALCLCMADGPRDAASPVDISTAGARGTRAGGVGSAGDGGGDGTEISPFEVRGRGFLHPITKRVVPYMRINRTFIELLVWELRAYMRSHFGKLVFEHNQKMLGRHEVENAHRRAWFVCGAFDAMTDFVSTMEGHEFAEIMKSRLRIPKEAFLGLRKDAASNYRGDRPAMDMTYKVSLPRVVDDAISLLYDVSVGKKIAITNSIEKAPLSAISSIYLHAVEAAVEWTLYHALQSAEGVVEIAYDESGNRLTVTVDRPNVDSAAFLTDSQKLDRYGLRFATSLVGGKTEFSLQFPSGRSSGGGKVFDTSVSPPKILGVGPYIILSGGDVAPSGHDLPYVQLAEFVDDQVSTPFAQSPSPNGNPDRFFEGLMRLAPGGKIDGVPVRLLKELATNGGNSFWHKHILYPMQARYPWLSDVMSRMDSRVHGCLFCSSYRETGFTELLPFMHESLMRSGIGPSEYLLPHFVRLDMTPGAHPEAGRHLELLEVRFKNHGFQADMMDVPVIGEDKYVQINVQTASRYHACIQAVEGKKRAFKVVDVDSDTGTTITRRSGETVTIGTQYSQMEAPLQDGDVITVGKAKLIFYNPLEHVAPLDPSFKGMRTAREFEGRLLGDLKTMDGNYLAKIAYLYYVIRLFKASPSPHRFDPGELLDIYLCLALAADAASNEEVSQRLAASGLRGYWRNPIFDFMEPLWRLVDDLKTTFESGGALDGDAGEKFDSIGTIKASKRGIWINSQTTPSTVASSYEDGIEDLKTVPAAPIAAPTKPPQRRSPVEILDGVQRVVDGSEAMFADAAARLGVSDVSGVIEQLTGAGLCARAISKGLLTPPEDTATVERASVLVEHIETLRLSAEKLRVSHEAADALVDARRYYDASQRDVPVNAADILKEAARAAKYSIASGFAAYEYLSWLHDGHGVAEALSCAEAARRRMAELWHLIANQMDLSGQDEVGRAQELVRRALQELETAIVSRDELFRRKDELTVENYDVWSGQMRSCLYTAGLAATILLDNAAVVNDSDRIDRAVTIIFQTIQAETETRLVLRNLGVNIWSS